MRYIVGVGIACGVKASARFVKGKGQVYISGYDATRDEGVALEHNNLVVFMPESTGETLIEFTVSGGVVDGDDAVVNEPMQWVVVVRKNGKEIDRKTLTFEDGKQILADDLNLYYK